MLNLRRSEIEWARLAQSAPAFAAPRRCRGRRAQGVRYERKAHAYFLDEFGDRYIPSPWFEFQLAGDTKKQWAQADGLLIDLDKGLITVCEMKYQHCLEAYWQLIFKYIPLVERIFPPQLWRVACVEVVKWYDCATKFPVDVKLRDRIDAVKPGEFAVHIWKP